MGSQGLEIGADLVADITVRGGPIRSDNHKINQTMLHQMSAGIVDDIGMRNPVASQLPGGDAALVPRPGLISINIDVDASFGSVIDRASCGAPVNRGKPPGIAMGENTDRLTLRFARRNIPD